MKITLTVEMTPELMAKEDITKDFVYAEAQFMQEQFQSEAPEGATVTVTVEE